MKKQRRLFTTEFKHDAAALVLDQGYSIAEACRSLDIGRMESYQLIDQLSEHEPLEKVCQALGIPRSSYYDYRSGRDKVDCSREQLSRQVERVFVVRVEALLAVAR